MSDGRWRVSVRRSGGDVSASFVRAVTGSNPVARGPQGRESRPKATYSPPNGIGRGRLSRIGRLCPCGGHGGSRRTRSPRASCHPGEVHSPLDAIASIMARQFIGSPASVRTLIAAWNWESLLAALACHGAPQPCPSFGSPASSSRCWSSGNHRSVLFTSGLRLGRQRGDPA